ncbi:MAG: GNAT family N-acetyltransferase [Candidatus Hydrogenedens sp.]
MDKKKDSEKILLTTWYLEIFSIPDFPPKTISIKDFHIERIEKPPLHFYRYLYDTIGSPWTWWERKLQSDEQLLQEIHKPEVELYVPYIQFLPIGMVELDFREFPQVQLAYFGIFPEYYNKKIGGYLLDWSIRFVFSRGAKRYWLHTCSLDSPNALPAYQKAGFQLYKTVNEYTEHPEIQIQKIYKNKNFIV